MSARHKTAKIVDIINEVNRRNRESICGPEVRNGWNSMLESILHAANVYSGFGYLEKDDVPKGHKPGIIKGDRSPYDQTSKGKPHKFPDESRVIYFIHPSLTAKTPKK